MASDAPSLLPGDLLRIERRYVVDGVLTCLTDQGRFEGIERVGTLEHVVIRDADKKEVRMFPLHTVAEITLVKPARRPKGARRAGAEAQAATAAPAWDPGVA